MSAEKKREAQSPLLGDDTQGKRRNILENPPSLVMLDELSGDSSQSDAESDLPVNLREDIGKSVSTLTVNDKVDKLIGRMDMFLECFNVMQKKSAKREKKDNKKFKCLETAHNDLITTVVDLNQATNSRLLNLEERLLISEDRNKDLSDKLAELESNYDRQFSIQNTINSDFSKKLTTLDLNLGHTDKNMLDLASEVKERKVIISRVQESQDEDVKTTALECINAVINAAITDLEPEASLNGLRILMPNAIDNVFRIGKPRGGRYMRNIAVTFIRTEDKEMVIRARLAVKSNEEINFFISDDLTSDGRALKAQLKKIAASAKEKGLDSKVSGNKVVIDSRSYASNELSLVPNNVTTETKQEKLVKGGLAYKGDRSIFSNFFPAPFRLGGEDYAHVEQYFQYQKAIHHKDDPTADRILLLTNPWRIKVLGDGIKPNESWNSKRMKTLYDGVSAKFRQNWPLQNELLKSKGMKLYEATTDPYYGCGIGFDSKRWNSMDWKGENVAGLVVMKVREELVHKSLSLSGHDENTLDLIASQHVDEDMELEADDGDISPLESTVIHRGSRCHDGGYSGSPLTNKPSYTGVVKSPGRLDSAATATSTPNRGRGNIRGRKPSGRGNMTTSWPNFSTPRGRGRGKGARRPYNRSFNSYRPQDRMSHDDKNFLFGYCPDEEGYIPPNRKKIVKSPTPGSNQKGNAGNDTQLTEHQRQGLVDLGLAPDSGFVRQAGASAIKATAKA